MTAPAPRRLLWLLAPVAAFAATLALLTAVQGGGGAAAPASSTGRGRRPSTPRPARRPRQTIAATCAAIEDEPGDAALPPTLGDLYYQRGRETANATLEREGAGRLRAALDLDPVSAQATLGLGTLALAKHDFAGGLRYGQEALALEPESSGRTRRSSTARSSSAATATPRALARPDGLARSRTSPPTRASPTSASFTATWTAPSRRCGWRCPPAAASRERRVRADAARQPASSSAARSARAERRVPDGARARPRLPARRGRARDRRGRAGRPRRGDPRYEAVVRASAVHEYHLLLLEAQLADGRTRPRAARSRRSARTRRSSARTASTRTPSWRSSRPTTDRPPARSSSAARAVPQGAERVVRRCLQLGADERRAGQRGAALGRQALRTGWRDPLARYHAGMAAKPAGRPALARRWLTQALAQNPQFSPLHAPRARARSRCSARAARARRRKPMAGLRAHRAGGAGTPPAAGSGSGSRRGPGGAPDPHRSAQPPDRRDVRLVGSERQQSERGHPHRRRGGGARRAAGRHRGHRVPPAT